LVVALRLTLYALYRSRPIHRAMSDRPVLNAVEGSDNYSALRLTPYSLRSWLLVLVPIYPASYYDSTNRIAGFIILDYNI
jgi:hypothetical protein